MYRLRGLRASIRSWRCGASDAVLEARGLTKRYGAFLALDRVAFQVRRSEILGYLGPNGFGKSTTVNTSSVSSSQAPQPEFVAPTWLNTA
jgi:ABC-type uncharacterized transport system ATPase subunit